MTLNKVTERLPCVWKVGNESRMKEWSSLNLFILNRQRILNEYFTSKFSYEMHNFICDMYTWKCESNCKKFVQLKSHH